MTVQRKEIETREDVKFLVERFYEKALVDPVIGFIFTDIAKIDPVYHFPRIIDFWEAILLETFAFQGNVMQVHLDLNGKVELKPEFFERWLELWKNTVDAVFYGERAERAKQRAESIATMMQIKMRRS
ncbi:MAG: group III truncated hemoglobin [Bacteroidota bacterium]